MKLLFNKDGQGSKEIQEILGFTDKDIKFEKLKPTIIPATDDLISLIGKPIYDIVMNIYEGGSASESDTEFCNRIQYVILLDAYRNFVIDNDLSHSPNGRFNRVEQNQKIAFEWQIERNNKSMERKYYKAIDALINYMDANVESWTSSDAYKASHNLFVRLTKDFDFYFNIEASRYLFIKLCPGLRKAEQEEILPRIGKIKFDELKSKLKDNDDSYDATFLELIKQATVYLALSWGIPRMSAQLFPEGLLEVADTSRLSLAARKSIADNRAEALSQRFKSDAESVLLKIETHIKIINKPEIEFQPITPNFNIDENFVNC